MLITEAGGSTASQTQPGAEGTVRPQRATLEKCEFPDGPLGAVDRLDNKPFHACDCKLTELLLA